MQEQDWGLDHYNVGIWDTPIKVGGGGSNISADEALLGITSDDWPTV